MYEVRFSFKWSVTYKIFKVVIFCLGWIKSKKIESIIINYLKGKEAAIVSANGKPIQTYYFKDFLNNNI